MSLFTSSQFASAAAEGTDWRDVSKKVLEQLEAAKAQNRTFNFGFLYVSDYLSQDAESILNLFRSVLKIDNWVGTVGIGVCAGGEAFIDTPAISAMIGHFAEDDFCIFPGADSDYDESAATLAAWLKKRDPMLTFVHGDPLSEEDPARTIKVLEQTTGGFLSGGLSSSRNEHAQYAGDLYNGGVSGVMFSQNIPVATTLSQGCIPVGKIHIITRGDDHVIRELDSESALKVFETDIRTMAIKKIDVDPDTVLVTEDAAQNRDVLPEEFKTLFKGEIHAAFPVSQSDQNDYLVRNIISFDPEDGSMLLSQNINTGESIMFVHRDDDTVQQDLSKCLMALRTRVTRDMGAFAPKGALYVSCVARAFSQIGTDPAQSEMRLIREIIGDVPLAGFYAGGEISNARLYGYTGILTLFL